MGARLPRWWEIICYITCTLSIIISVYGIFKQWLNYRKPMEQRLIIRILLLVPLFSITCITAIKAPTISQNYLDPIREFYEAFVIYTFFSLLTWLLGGERTIITNLSVNHIPTRHGLKWLGTIDLSDPNDYLSLKRGILQYVWFKPFYCFILLICETNNWNKFQFWLLILYNLSVTWSLYNIAMFWKCLYIELKPFNPWLKFLCVKLIISASYWQSIFIHALGLLGIFGPEPSSRIYLYENGILCIEMLGFAILHQQAFSWVPFSIHGVPNGAKMKLSFAIRDSFGIKDLIWDFKQTLLIGHTYYNFKNFDTAEQNSLNKRKNIRNTMNRLNEGYRYSNQGGNSHWIRNYGSISQQSITSDTSHENSIALDNEDWDTSMCDVPRATLHDDPNYPVIWDSQGYKFTNNINKLKRDIQSRTSSV